MSLSRSNPDPVLSATAIEALLDALQPVSATPPIAAMKTRLMERIAREENAPDAPGITTIRAGTGQWSAVAPGVEGKVLFDDGRTRTWLARMERESRLPGHRHHQDEECLLLEGSVFLGNVQMAPGDYQMARAGTLHDEIYSPTGCLLLVRSASPEAMSAA